MSDIHLIDVFPYNGESIVALRLAEVYPHVDEIVVTEARETHSGLPKDELFFEKHADIFEPYRDKLQVCIVDAFDKGPIPQKWMETRKGCVWMLDNKKAWYRESTQRDACGAYLASRIKELGKTLIICSDVDEIPNMRLITAMKETMYRVSHETGSPVRLEMAMFYYSWKWMKPYKWYHAFMCAGECLTRYTLDEMRVLVPKTHVLKDAGWHCSYFMTSEDLVRKLRSFSHRECDTEEARSEDHVQACLTTGRDLFGRGEHENCRVREDGMEMPEHWQEFSH